MSERDVDELCIKVVKLSTHRRQLLKTIEELSEMNRAISRYLEDDMSDANRDNMFEELAHAIIMIKQTEIILLDDLGDDEFYERMEKWEENTLNDLESVIEELKLKQ